MTDDQRIDYIARNVEAFGQWLERFSTTLSNIHFSLTAIETTLRKIERQHKNSLKRKRTKKR